MKQFFTLIITAVAALTLQAAVADQTLLSFGINNHDDWYYNRDDVVVDNDAINTNRIALYTGEDGKQYTLLSPTFSTQQVDSLKVAMTIRLAEDNNYNPAKLIQRVEMIDAGGEVVATADVPVEPGSMMQTLVVTFAVPSMAQATLLFSAPKALEIENNIPAVRSIKVWPVTKSAATEPVRGDVNGDGKVDVADVNIIINIMLGKVNSDELRAASDLTGDGQVDVSDANSVINLMLGK